jgi:hypothetical protein
MPHAQQYHQAFETDQLIVYLLQVDIAYLNRDVPWEDRHEW